MIPSLLNERVDIPEFVIWIELPTSSVLISRGWFPRCRICDFALPIPELRVILNP
jgi:hypothetical protein